MKLVFSLLFCRFGFDRETILTRLVEGHVSMVVASRCSVFIIASAHQQMCDIPSASNDGKLFIYS